MQRKHHSTVCFVLVVGSVLLIGCTRKPAFRTPAIIINHPVAVQSSSAASLPPVQPVVVSAPIVSAPSVATSLPESILINVPFAPQAPFAIWDALHEEACEEMALIMVHHFLAGTELSMETAEAEVQSMVAWHREQGYADDVSSKELGEIAVALYGYKVRILSDVTADTLRQELARGNPVIIPAAGRELHNPFFSGEGPFYHMLVVIGYTSDGFITNDPGTKQGKQYWYSTEVLMDALHDWVGVKEQIATGPKTALVIER